MAAPALGGLEHPQSDHFTDGDICCSQQGGDISQEDNWFDNLFHCRARSSPTFSRLAWAFTASCASTAISKSWVRAPWWGQQSLRYLQSPLATPSLWSCLRTSLQPTNLQTTLHPTTLHLPTQGCLRARMKFSTWRRRNMKILRLKDRPRQRILTNTFHRAAHSRHIFLSITGFRVLNYVLRARLLDILYIYICFFFSKILIENIKIMLF